jgi:hypothetical protein
MLGAGSHLWWIVPVTSLLAAVVGASAAFAGLVWRYRADYRRDVVRELLQLIQHAADTATEYWLLDMSQGDGDINKFRSYEARITGLSERIDAGIEAARPHLRRIDTLGMERPWLNFLDNMTGGQFSDQRRPPDYARCQGVQVAAASLIGDLRTAADRKFLNVG